MVFLSLDHPQLPRMGSSQSSQPQHPSRAHHPHTKHKHRKEWELPVPLKLKHLSFQHSAGIRHLSETFVPPLHEEPQTHTSFSAGPSQAKHSLFLLLKLQVEERKKENDTNETENVTLREQDVVKIFGQNMRCFTTRRCRAQVFPSHRNLIKSGRHAIFSPIQWTFMLYAQKKSCRRVTKVSILPTTWKNSVLDCKNGKGNLICTSMVTCALTTELRRRRAGYGMGSNAFLF